MSDADHTSPTRRVVFAAETTRRPGRVALRVLDGDAPGQTSNITAPVVTVGRSNLADLVVHERSVSAVHCELRPTPAGSV